MPLFGTDGVRGTAGAPPLDEPTILRIGAALVEAVRGRSANGGPELRRDTAAAPERPLAFLVGRDTRESGEWIERTLSRAIRGEGARLVSAGVIPTPAIAYLTRRRGFDAGIVISASHNPFQDNGIKVFSGEGEKFSTVLEQQIETRVADAAWQPLAAPDGPVEQADVLDDYVAHLQEVFGTSTTLGDTRIAVDCANGATSRVAPELFRRLVVGVDFIHCAPDGRNINLKCGSTHPEVLVSRVVSGGYRLGVAFDGDGDRAIFVDHTGRIVDGDAILLIAAVHLKSQNRLRGNAIVATVMSNLGLEIALRSHGIGIVRCPVGDRFVMEEIQKRNLSLGGEQSGHIIFADYLYTGDGLATAVAVMRIMADTGRELADLAAEHVPCPQLLLNVRVKTKPDIESVPALTESVRRVEERLGNEGRLLVRYSGTEPLLRVMIEGTDEDRIRTWAEEIAEVARRELG